MIFHIKFEDGRAEYCTANGMLDLLQSYDRECGLNLHEVESVEEISEKEAESIFFDNPDFDQNNPNEPEKIPLSDVALWNEFKIVASTEFE